MSYLTLRKKINNKQATSFLKQGGWMLRNIFDFDCQQETSFWYIIKDHFGGYEELSRNVRNQVRRALRVFDFCLISRDFLLKNGYPVFCAAVDSYKVKAKKPTFAEFQLLVENLGTDYEFYAAIHKETKKLVAFSLNRIIDNTCNYSTLKANPIYMKKDYVYYGLLFEMNQHYLQDRKMQYVSDGARSITEHSNIQPFLIDRFGFRKAYCQMQMYYVPWFHVAVTILSPLRHIIPFRSIRAILFQHCLQTS